MVKCCVKQCKNSRNKSLKHSVTFHRFPADERLRHEWVAAVEMSSEPDLANHSFVCSEHFLPSCYAMCEKRKRLQPNARPTVRLSPGEEVKTDEPVSPLITCEQINLPEYYPGPPSIRFQVCRVCLATDTRMYDMRQNGTEAAYSLLLARQISESGLPSIACYECSARLHNLNRFALKAQCAYKLLMQMLNSDGQILETSVKEINRDKEGLISSLKCRPSIDVDSYKPKETETDINREHKVDLFNDFEVKTKPLVDLINSEFVETEVKEELDHKIGNLTNNYEDLFPEEGGTKLIRVKKGNKAKKKRKEEKSKLSLRKTKLLVDQESDVDLEDELCAGIVDVKQNVRVATWKEMNRYKNYKDEYEEFATVTVMTEQERLELFRERALRRGYLHAPHRCDDCYLGFCNRRAYDNHRRRHEPSAGAHECEICRLRMRTERQLAKHLSMNHRTRFACKRCPHVCSNAERARHHEATHTKSSYHCEDCNRTFARQLPYKRHMHLKHPAELPCAACGMTYLGRAALRAHATLRHNNVIDREAGASPCCECGIDFHSESALQRHLATSARHSPATAIWACEVCDETFSEKARAVAHRSAHRDTSRETITCEQCGEAMADGRAYHAHFRRAHRGATRTLYAAARAAMCEQCGKMFANATQLREHSSRHTGERPYACDACGKTFASAATRALHARTHTRELPHRCGECGRAFADYSNMARHRAVHTDAKPFECDICAKSFKYRRTLTDHVQYVHLRKPWPKRVRRRAKPSTAAAASDA